MKELLVNWILFGALQRKTESNEPEGDVKQGQAPLQHYAGNGYFLIVTGICSHRVKWLWEPAPQLHCKP